MEVTMLRRHNEGSRGGRRGRRKSSSGTHAANMFNFEAFANSSSDDGGREADEENDDSEQSAYCYDNPVSAQLNDGKHFEEERGVAERTAVKPTATMVRSATWNDISRDRTPAFPKPRSARSNGLPALFSLKTTHPQMDIFHKLDRVIEDEDRELEKIEEARQQHLENSDQPRQTPLKRNQPNRPKQASGRFTRTQPQFLSESHQNHPPPPVFQSPRLETSTAIDSAGRSGGNRRLQLEPLTQSLQDLCQQNQATDSEDIPTATPLPMEETCSDSQENEARKHTTTIRGSWLWSLIKRKVKQPGGLTDEETGSHMFPDVGGKSKKTKGLPIARLFARSQGEHSGTRSVFTVTDGDSVIDDDVGPGPSSSLENLSGMPQKGRGLTGPQGGLPQISLRRRTNGYEDDVARLRLSGSPSALSLSSRSPSPLVQLSDGDLFTVEEDAASITSSMTSTSLGSIESQSDSSDSDKALTKLKERKLTREHSDETSSFENGKSENLGSSSAIRRVKLGEDGCGMRPSLEDLTRSRHSSLEDQKRCAQSLSSSRCCSDGTFNSKGLAEDGFEGPHGKLFTAKLFNRIGSKGALCNVTHVSHVYKGMILVTDLLEGKVLFAARSGRWAKSFVAEKGAEPWSACITPRGHVAVTLRRLACVTVWSGNGTLVREFGHGVLECPTGLVVDQQGRFIVTDERTNRVSIFSPAGEFLRYLARASTQQKSEKQPSKSAYAKNAKKVAINTNSNSSNNNSDISSQEEDEVEDEYLVKASRYGGVVKEKRPIENPATNIDTTTKGSSSKDQTGEINPGTHPNRDEKSSTTTTITATATAGKDVSSTTSTSQANKDEYEPYVFSDPRYVCVTGSGKIIVSDSGNHTVKVFTPEGTYLHSIGSYGNRDGQLKVPYGVCSDQQENVYIADHYNDRVSVFSIDGVFLQHALTATSGLSRPKSLAIRPAHVRKLYIAHGGLRSTEVLVYRLIAGRPNMIFKFDL